MKVLVVGHSSYEQQLQAWAATAGLPSSSIVTSSSCIGLLQGLAAAASVDPQLSGCFVLAADANYVLEPGSSLSRLVEAAVVHGKDTITCTVPFQGADLSQLVQVHREDAAAENSCVTICAATNGAADGCLDTIMGPAAVLAPSTINCLQYAGTTAVVERTGSGLQAIDSLQEFGMYLQQLQEHDNTLVYCIDLPFYFSLSRADYGLTDAFFSHYKELHLVAKREVQHLAVGIDGKAPASITGTLSDLVSKLESLGRATRQPPSPVRQQLVATVSPARPAGGLGSSLSGGGSNCGTQQRPSSTAGACSSQGSSSNNSLKHMFEEFCIKYHEQLAKQAKAPISHDYNTLPNRFVHPEAWQQRPTKQHPCYATSSHDYGAKQPTGFDMPPVWAGIHGKFTDTFHGGCYRSMGLKTSVERSRVHRGLDYL